jgi:hypothetical protein
MLSIQQLDRLAGAVVLDRNLGRTFIQNRLEAIDTYNSNFAARYGEKPINLSDEEKEIITSVLANDLPDFFAQMLSIIGSYHKSSKSTLPVAPGVKFERIPRDSFGLQQDSVA